MTEVKELLDYLFKCNDLFRLIVGKFKLNAGILISILLLVCIGLILVYEFVKWKLVLSCILFLADSCL